MAGAPIADRCGGFLVVVIALSTALAPSAPELQSDHAINGLKLGGVQVITAEDSISADDVTISSGSHVTLESGKGVALGDGLVVDEGAVLVVSIKQRPFREPEGE